MSDAYNEGFVDLNAGRAAAMSLVGGLLAALFAAIFAYQVTSIPLDPSKRKTIQISEIIARCSAEFLRDEYKALGLFCVIVAIFLVSAVGWESMICFLVGASLSALSGYLGMSIATKANVRTTMACQGSDGLNRGLQVAFKSGAVMGLSVVASGLLGVPILYLLFDKRAGADEKKDVWEQVSAFAFGGSSIALFARVAGGIYTKAADVGADLVGKVEEDLEEDSPDNPATIADNVGDNVGDVAGMGADLFESYVGSIIAACTIGWPKYGYAGVALPFWVAGLGSICSIIGVLLIRTKGNTQNMSPSEVLESLLGSIRFSIYVSSVLVIIASIFALGATFGLKDWVALEMGGCILIGLGCGNLIGYFTEYCTSYTYEPTKSIADKSDMGAAPVVIQGLGVGMLSTVPPVVFVFIATLAAYALADIYGISIAAVGMLSTLGVTLATDAFGPVADNAGGIAEMAPDSEISSDVRDTTDALDALGNTTAATGKGFAIGSAVLTALALLNAFAEATGLDFVGVDLLDKVVLPAVIFGAMLPFVFAALTMLSVGRAAESVMWECRDQLNRRFFDASQELDAAKCVKICAYASLKEMLPPGLLAVVTPLLIGFLLGPKGLLGMLVGAIASGFLMAVMMSNAGGAWDNAKKYVEKGNLGKGKGKGSINHKATVVGDTIGDPFKDTSGPSLNILIKLMSVVSLVIAPLLTSGKTPAGDPIPKDDWEDWWIALILSAVLLVIAYIYQWLMKRYGTIHDHDYIFREAERRKAEQGRGGKKAEHKEEAKGDDDNFAESGDDVSLDSVGKGKGQSGSSNQRLLGDADGGYGALH